MPVQNYAATDGIQNSRSEVAANSTTILTGDPLTRAASGAPRKAGATGQIIGIANNHVTAAANNETVGLLKVSYQLVNDNTYYELPISGGAVTAASKGLRFVMLANGTAVDGASASATLGQFVLVDFKSATVGVFRAEYYI